MDPLPKPDITALKEPGTTSDGSDVEPETVAEAGSGVEGDQPPVGNQSAGVGQLRKPVIIGLEQPGTTSDGSDVEPETESWIIRGRLMPEVELNMIRDRGGHASPSGDDTRQWAPRSGMQITTDPRALGAYKPDRGEVRELAKQLRKATWSEPTSVLFVGNDPLVGWLASELTGSRRGVAIARGEMLCLAPPRWPFQRRWRILWNIAGEKAVLEEITSKIQSKMDTAKTLGAVITALATFVLTQGFSKGSTWWLWAALACLAASGILFFFTLFFYDTLLMPQRFWGGRLRARIHVGRVSVQRPPGSTDRVLHDAMVRIWVRIFTPAIWLAGMGVVLLAGHAAASSSSLPSQPEGGGTRDAAPSPAPDSSAVASASFVDVDPRYVIAVAVGLLVVVGTWAWLNRPTLGVSD